MLNFIIIILLLLSLYLIIPIINNKLVFLPNKVSNYNYYLICNNLKNNYIPITVKTDDNIILNGGLLNFNKKPNWEEDNIILYSHGNIGWLGTYIKFDTMKMLSNFGSILLYDYRGYGINQGIPTENGLYTDIRTIYKFLVKEKKVNPNKIIIYGYSLGSGVSSNLITYLIKNKLKLPKALVLEAPFISINEMVKEISILLLPFVTVSFNNLSNILQINNKIPIYSIHSIYDELVPFRHSEILQKYSNCNLIEIKGDHINPVFNQKVYELFENISK